MYKSYKQTIKFSTLSTKGLRYEKNEDSLIALAEHGIFAVADGMGGHNGGAIASNMIKDLLLDNLSSLEQSISLEALANIIHSINTEIYNLAQITAELKGMGSTLSLLYLDKGKINCIHVGDSRIYRLLNFQLEQISADHTKNSKDLGQVSDMRKPQRGITRAIGVKSKVELDVFSFEHIDSAEYLLVTDGITDQVADFETANIITNLEESYNKRVQRLVSLAIEKGGSDDKTVIFLSGPT